MPRQALAYRQTHCSCIPSRIQHRYVKSSNRRTDRYPSLSSSNREGPGTANQNAFACAIPKLGIPYLCSSSIEYQRIRVPLSRVKNCPVSRPACFGFYQIAFEARRQHCGHGGCRTQDPLNAFSPGPRLVSTQAYPIRNWVKSVPKRDHVCNTPTRT